MSQNMKFEKESFDLFKNNTRVSHSRSGKTIDEAHHRHHESVAGNSRLFFGIQPQEYQGIRVAARVKEFTRGERLFMETEPVQQVFVITSGFVKITQLGPGGAEATLKVAAPGDVIDAVCGFSSGKHTTTAQAIRKCQALVWDAVAFRNLEQANPILHQNRLHILGCYVLELEERFREVATERVGPRVARQLLRLMATMGQTVDGSIEVSLTRQELAEMTGTTLFTVSRLLSAWEARGLVAPRREGVTILDVQSLRTFTH